MIDLQDLYLEINGQIDWLYSKPPSKGDVI